MKDIDLSLTKNPITGSFVTLDMKNAIMARIRNLLMLRTSDITYRDFMYTNLTNLLGENMTFAVAAMIKENIRFAIEKFIPEVELLDIKIQADYDNQLYRIKLIYSILSEINNTEQTIILNTTN
mgnify:CR=1 FL=1